MSAIDIKAIRPKVYAALRKAGVEIAKSYPSRIRGMRNWSRGVILIQRFGGIGSARGVYVESYYDIRQCREQDEAHAIAALRAAGWTVSDDGRIGATPTPNDGAKE